MAVFPVVLAKIRLSNSVHPFVRFDSLLGVAPFIIITIFVSRLVFRAQRALKVRDRFDLFLGLDFINFTVTQSAQKWHKNTFPLSCRSYAFIRTCALLCVYVCASINVIIFNTLMNFLLLYYVYDNVLCFVIFFHRFHFNTLILFQMFFFFFFSFLFFTFSFLFFFRLHFSHVLHTFP